MYYYIILNKENIIVKVEQSDFLQEDSESRIQISQKLYEEYGMAPAALVGHYYNKNTKEIINLELEIYKALMRLYNPFIKF